MSAGHTIVKYGNVTLYRVTTEKVHQQAVFDASNTDLLYVKTRIRITGFIHGHAVPSDWDYKTNDDSQGVNYSGSAAAAEAEIRRRLAPRQRFQMWLGCTGDGNNPDGQILFDIQAYQKALSTPKQGPRTTPTSPSQQTLFGLKGYDVANGPKNESFEITHVTGNEVFKVSAEFELCILECDFDQYIGNNYGVLSNRWGCVDSLDANLMVTRTYTGQIVCASANINIQSFRWMAVPPLQPLMRIDSMSFDVAADGLTMNWTMVHKEIAASAPWPARTWQVTHTEEIENGQIGYSTVDVNLTGDSRVNKGDLITLAYYLIYAKVFGKTPDNVAAAPGILGQYIVQSIAFVDSIGDVNAISARARVQRKLAVNQNATMAMGLLGQPITSEDLPAPKQDPATQKTDPLYKQSLSWGAYDGQTPEFQGPVSLAGIFACYLQNPCSDQHTVYYTGQTKPNDDYNQNADTLAYQPKIDTPGDIRVYQSVGAPSYYSLSQQTNLYTYYKITNIYTKRTMRAMMPTMQNNGDPTDDGSVFVQLAAPQSLRILRVSAERIGNFPEFPDPENLPPFLSVSGSGAGAFKTIRQYLLSSKLAPNHPKKMVDGQFIYSAMLECKIGLSRSPLPTERLQLGNEKWMNLGNQFTGSGSELTNSSWL